MQAASTTRSAAAPAPVQAIRPEPLRLPRGRAVLLRGIGPQDAEAEQAFVSELSLDSRHKRFHIGLRQLSPALLRQLTEVDQHQHVALVAQELLLADAGGGWVSPRLVADARYVRDTEQPDEAEFAIAVADDWQSLGLGRHLMARLAANARRQGLRALTGDVLLDNRRMLVLMRSLGASTRAHPDGPQLVRVVFDLASVELGRPAHPADIVAPFHAAPVD